MTVILKVKHAPTGRFWYLLWSTVSDAPASRGMTLEQLVEHTREESGRRGVEELEERLKRVEAKGTSSLIDDDAEMTVLCNRAGPRETRLTLEQIVQTYCIDPPKRMHR